MQYYLFCTVAKMAVESQFNNIQAKHFYAFLSPSILGLEIKLLNQFSFDLHGKLEPCMLM